MLSVIMHVIAVNMLLQRPSHVFTRQSEPAQCNSVSLLTSHTSVRIYDSAKQVRIFSQDFVKVIVQGKVLHMSRTTV